MIEIKRKKKSLLSLVCQDLDTLFLENQLFTGRATKQQPETSLFCVFKNQRCNGLGKN